MAKRKVIPKPFSEMSTQEQIASARNSLMNLQHPHNAHMPEIQKAIRRWQDFLRSKGVQP